MKSRTIKAIINSLALVVSMTLAPFGASAQEGGGTVALSNQSGHVSVKLERGSRVSISNRYGRITVTGWDRDTVEASASSTKGAEAIQVEMTADPQSRSAISLAVVGHSTRPGPYTGATPPAPATAPRPNTNPAPNPRPATAPEAERERAREAMRDQINEAAKNGVILVPIPQITIQTPSTPGGRGIGIGIGGGASSDQGITLDVKVPRYAALDTIEVRAGDLNVSGIDGPVSVLSGSSDITASHLGSLEVRTRSGNVNVEDVDGLIYVVASSSNISVRRSQGDVRATTINGNINVQCVKGRVDASTSRGEIILTNVGGDVEATTTDSPINFTGAITPNGRYRLKSMEGKVTMSIPDGSPGFTANLMSYNSDAVTDFDVRGTSANTNSQASRRLEARHGDGHAQITLDSFSQSVRLSKLTGAMPACQ
ncbi:MAG: hypothetical protein QOE33_2146 [Acidobacteriota bacterium]|nr:hypothetical protein [Acidobacteriota bacterium]